MNILAKCKGIFPTATKAAGDQIIRAPIFQKFLDDWNKLVKSSTIVQFEQALQKFKEEHQSFPAALEYALKTWIKPWKEHFIFCFIDKYRHFGHYTTSVVESLHSTFKASLWSRTGDLMFVFRALDAFWKGQIANIQILQSLKMNKLLTATLKPLYSVIRSKASSVALQLLLQQEGSFKADLSEAPANSCPCKMAVAYGLPCRHLLWRRLKDNEPLVAADFDLYWLWNCPADEPDSSSIDAPLEPLIVRAKGRPKGALGLERRTDVEAACREPSLFERVQATEVAEARAPPPSTAPAALGEAIHNSSDPYEPGTAMPRAYQRHNEVTEIEDDELIPDSALSCIVVECEGAMDRMIEDLELSQAGLEEDLQNGGLLDS